MYIYLCMQVCMHSCMVTSIRIYIYTHVYSPSPVATGLGLSPPLDEFAQFYKFSSLGIQNPLKLESCLGLGVRV